MQDCQICFETKYTKSSCGCQYCETCLFKWASVSLNTIDQLKCPYEACNFIYDRYKLMNLFNEQKEEFQNILIKQYQQQSADILQCPLPQCHYFGLNNRNFCFSYQCQLCGHKWRTGQTMQTYIKKSFYNIFSFIYIFLYTNQCPTCNVHIEKNEGCSNISCAHCKQQFCWICFKATNVHQQSCGLNSQFYQATILYLLLSLLYTSSNFYFMQFLPIHSLLVINQGVVIWFLNTNIFLIAVFWAIMLSEESDQYSIQDADGKKKFILKVITTGMVLFVCGYYLNVTNWQTQIPDLILYFYFYILLIFYPVEIFYEITGTDDRFQQQFRLQFFQYILCLIVFNPQIGLKIIFILSLVTDFKQTGNRPLWYSFELRMLILQLEYHFNYFFGYKLIIYILIFINESFSKFNKLPCSKCLCAFSTLILIAGSEFIKYIGEYDYEENLYTQLARRLNILTQY